MSDEPGRMQGPQGEGVLSVGGGDLGDNPGAREGWKQEIGWDFSMNLSCNLSALKDVGVPRNHEWHGRV